MITFEVLAQSLSDSAKIMHMHKMFSIFAQGIPVIYYGTEQGFTGGHDPANRESLWPHYNTDHWLYIYISTIVKFRVQQGEKLYEAKQVERYVDEHFFAFSRGKVGTENYTTVSYTHHCFSS